MNYYEFISDQPFQPFIHLNRFVSAFSCHKWHHPMADVATCVVSKTLALKRLFDVICCIWGDDSY